MPVLLHAHSWYSLLDGVSSPQALLARAAECGYTALALTDSNNLYGAVQFAGLAAAHGVRPILGACLRDDQTRCVALIAEPAGYHSLCRVISRLNLQAGSLPVLLGENHAGLHVLADDFHFLQQLREAFGPRLWLEIVRPDEIRPHPPAPSPQGRGGEDALNISPFLLAAARRLGIQPIASAAARFARPEEYHTFRLATAVRKGILLEQLPARLSITPEHHLIDPNTLQHRFRDLPEAVRNTDVLAEQLRSDVLPRTRILPPCRLPRGLDAARFLRLLCERGLQRRYEQPADEARQRLRQELAVIEARGLAGYFLVVRDLARYARRQGHPMALRGSAGNSLACFLLEITDVDPLRFDLPMERFLHMGREDLPDIDLDFDWKVRDDVIAWAFQRYGAEHTAMISSHLFLQPASAFREAAKVHGLSNAQISRLVESGIGGQESGVRSQESGVSADGHWSLPSYKVPTIFPLEPERWPRLIDDARLLLGRPHHLSVHPGGIVITPGPIEEHIPLQRAAKGIIITQLDKDGVEQVGLVKIDLLGNRALGTVEEATRGQAYGEPSVGFDPAAIVLLQRGDTLGVNQLESPAMRHLLIQMKPDGLDHIIQALALIRPGAASIGAKESFLRRRRGLEPIRYVHSRLESVLHETCGLMVYEDDALRVIQALTGLPLPEADMFRKRIAKHRTDDEARALAIEFLAACERHGIPRAVAGEQWVQLAKFNRYSFCKSHAVSYGLIAWQAARLKAHEPLRFWTAALNNNQGMYPRRVYIEAVKRAGITLLLPCVNRSLGPFTVEGNAIRTGLDAIGTLDESLRQTIIAARQYGRYRDLADFCQRVQPGQEALALLVRCGAFDFTGQSRPALFLRAEETERCGDVATRGRGDTESPRRHVSASPRRFPSPCRLPFTSSSNDDDWQPADYSAMQRRRDEWRILGFVVGPLMMALFRPTLPQGLTVSRDLPQLIGRTIRLAGLVATARFTETSDGRTMQFVTLEDEWGLVEVTLFPGTCPLLPSLTLGPYLVTGRVEEQLGCITLNAQSVLGGAGSP